MKSIYLGTEFEIFNNKYKNELLDYYGNKTEIVAEDNTAMLFKIPFAPEYFTRVRYNSTTVKIGKAEDIDGTDINTDFVFRSGNLYTEFTLLMLKDNSISLLVKDSSTSQGGNSLYTIANTDKGLIFFSYCERPSNINDAKSIHVESNKDLTPLTFGNQYVTKSNEVLKQPLKFTDSDGVIYTCKDVYNISYKPEDLILSPNSFISNVGGSNKVNLKEKFNTSILIYNEES